MSPISSAPPRGNRSEAVASIVGHMKQTPAPHSVAASSPVTGEFAPLSAPRVRELAKHPPHRYAGGRAFGRRELDADAEDRDEDARDRDECKLGLPAEAH